MSNIVEAIRLIYPDIQGGFTYWETEYNCNNWQNPVDGLVWENNNYPKPSWSQITEKINQLSLINAKKDKISKINNQRDSRLIQNTPQTLNVYQGTNLVSKQFQVNPACYAQWNARIKLLEERKASGEQNPTYPWIALDNEIYDLTLNDFKSLLSHLVDRENTEHIQARLRKDAVNVLTTIQEVEAFDITQILIP